MVPAVVAAAAFAALLPALGPAGAERRRSGRPGGTRPLDHAALGPPSPARVREPVPVAVGAGHAAGGRAPAGHAGRHETAIAPAGDHPALGPAVTPRRAAAYAARDVNGGPAHDAALSALADPFAALFSRPSRRLVVAITALWSVAAVPGLAVLTHRHLRVGALAEAVAYLLLALGLASITGVRRTFRRVARLPALILVVGAVLVTFGQLGGGGRHFFPLVRFNVYTDSIPDNSDFTNLEGVTASGDRVLVHGADVFHSMENGRFGSFHAHLFGATGIASGRATDGRHDGAVDDYRRFLVSLLRQYNEEHAGTPLAAIELVAYHAPDVPEVADHRTDLTSHVLISVHADGTYVLPPTPPGFGTTNVGSDGGAG
jgi:hypothetical protein